MHNAQRKTQKEKRRQNPHGISEHFAFYVLRFAFLSEST